MKPAASFLFDWERVGFTEICIEPDSARVITSKICAGLLSSNSASFPGLRGGVEWFQETMMKFLHVVSAVAMVAGLIARDLVLGRARRSKDLAQVELLLEVSNPFEKMVVYGSVSVLVFGIVTMLIQGRPLFQAGSYWLPTSMALFATNPGICAHGVYTEREAI